ncbi:MAG: uncharacterized protein QOI42_1034 [Frankiaceae bacterium]|jgi:predicted enzyme related to lactoylglutathione lyase|nr:uncharacterized protein [Frankiaceae bacterium]
MPTDRHIDVVEFPAATPELLQRSTRFFGAVFGWTFTSYGDGYADTTDAGVTAGVNATDPGERSRAPLAVLYVDDLEATRAAVTAAGGTVTQDIYGFPGGRRFHFTEPAGNELAAWSDH